MKIKKLLALAMLSFTIFSTGITCYAEETEAQTETESEDQEETENEEIPDFDLSAADEVIEMGEVNGYWFASEKTLVVDGDGYMKDYGGTVIAPWYDERFNVSGATAIVNGNVKNVGSYCFWGSKAFKKIIVQDGVEEIGVKAFYDNRTVREVVLPDSVTEIGEAAFQNCAAIREINLGENIEYIGKDAFSGCEGIKELTIPITATLDQNVFSGMNARKIHFTSGTDGIGCDYSESDNYWLPWGAGGNVNEITFDDGIKRIGSYMFSGSKINEIGLPLQLEEIGEGAFKDCYNLRGIAIPSSVKVVEDNAFWNTGIEAGSIAFPSECEVSDYVYGEEYFKEQQLEKEKADAELKAEEEKELEETEAETEAAKPNKAIKRVSILKKISKIGVVIVVIMAVILVGSKAKKIWDSVDPDEPDEDEE